MQGAQSQPQELTTEQYRHILSNALRDDRETIWYDGSREMHAVVVPSSGNVIDLFRDHSGKCYYQKRIDSPQSAPAAPDTAPPHANTGQEIVNPKGIKAPNIDKEFPDSKRIKTPKIDKKFPGGLTKSFRDKRQVEKRKAAVWLDLMRLSHSEVLGISETTLVSVKERTTNQSYPYSRWRDLTYDQRHLLAFIPLKETYNTVQPFDWNLSTTTISKVNELGGNAASAYIGKRLSKAKNQYQNKTGNEFDCYIVLERAEDGRPHAHGIIGHNAHGRSEMEELRAAIRSASVNPEASVSRHDVTLRAFKEQDGGVEGWIKYCLQDHQKKTPGMRIGKPYMTRKLRREADNLHNHLRAFYNNQPSQGAPLH